MQLQLRSLLVQLMVATASGLAAAQFNSSAADNGPQPRNNRVLIGLLTQNSDPSPRGQSYIAASYVKFLEAAGARVVPFLHDLPKHEIKRRCCAALLFLAINSGLVPHCNIITRSDSDWHRFNIVNGFLIPGGAAPLRPGHTFFDTAAEVVRLADEANGRGDSFPILGICLGFETLAIVTSGNTSIMGRWAGLCMRPHACLCLPLSAHAP